MAKKVKPAAAKKPADKKEKKPAAAAKKNLPAVDYSAAALESANTKPLSKDFLHFVLKQSK